MYLAKNQKGFSFIEILVAIGVLVILLSITTVNLLQATSNVNQYSVSTIMEADLKTQQIKAVNGDTEGSGTQSSYGIYFESNKYTLFRGSSYSLSNPTNFVVTLSSGSSFTNILFPNSTVIFAPGSGEISNFASGSNSITIVSNDNTQKTIILNRFGAITSN